MKEKKVKKTATVRRPKFADEKYLGSEPVLKADSTLTDQIRAYNWYNYFYSSEDAKSFTLSYLKSIKYDKSIIQKLSKVKPLDLHNIGWNCRLLANGSTLPDGVWEKIEKNITRLTQEITDVVEEDNGEVPVKVI